MKKNILEIVLFIGAVFFWFAAGLAAKEAAVNASSSSTRPNIVVIMTDDQDDIGSMSVMPKTLKLIGDEGLTFTNSFVDFSLCCPSRASFLTGQASHNSGILNNDPPYGGYAKFQPTEGNAMPAWLQQAGYVTAHIGKYFNGYGYGAHGSSTSIHIPPGWNFWNGTPDSDGSYRYYNYSINENGVLHHYGSAPADYKTDVLAQKAVNFIASQQSSTQPFFLSLAPLAPHFDVSKGKFTAIPAPRHKGMFRATPLPQSPSFNESDMSDKPVFMRMRPVMITTTIASVTDSFRKRRESLLAVDDMVEGVVNALESSGKLNNTVIFFTSDNGYIEGQHRTPGGKQLVYEESIRVPLLIRGPGIARGETRPQLVNNLDLAATIEDLSSLTPGRTPDGRSLTSLFQNASTPWRTSLLVQGLTHHSKNIFIYSRFQAVRTNNYIYIEHVTGAPHIFEREFYDLASDPYELTSKHNDPAYSGIISSLQGILNNLKSCVGNGCWDTSFKIPPPNLP